MKKLIWIIGILVIVGCEGPAGPQGPEGSSDNEAEGIELKWIGLLNRAPSYEGEVFWIEIYHLPEIMPDTINYLIHSGTNNVSCKTINLYLTVGDQIFFTYKLGTDTTITSIKKVNIGVQDTWVWNEL